MDDDLPPDLARLRTLETWAAHYLTRIRARTPDWGLAESGVGVPVPEVHRGDCWAGGRSLVPVTAERARAELADGAQPCAVCRPDRVLNRT